MITFRTRKSANNLRSLHFLLLTNDSWFSVDRENHNVAFIKFSYIFPNSAVKRNFSQCEILKETKERRKQITP